MTTSRNTNPELTGSENDEGNGERPLPGSAAGAAGLIPPNPNLTTSDALDAKVPSTTPRTSNRERAKPPQKFSWWPIALLIAVVAGVGIVAAANPGHNERGNESAPGSHGAEKLPEKTPGSALERTP